MSRDFAIEPLGPQVISVAHVHELRGHANAAAGSPDAALEHGADVERAPDLAHVHVLALEREGRRARDDPQVLHVRERVDEFLRHAVAEVLLIVGRAHVDKRQHRDRLPRGDRGFRCELFEIGLQLSCGGAPPPGLLLEASPEDARQVGRQVRPEVLEGWRRIPEDGRQQAG